jgi:REP element-mobilizing transposase RayT
MARQLRIEFEGAYYHILSRGNNQSNIFHSDEDRQDFLYILADMSERFEIEIYTYVLMDIIYVELNINNDSESASSRSMVWRSFAKQNRVFPETGFDRYCL